MTALLVLALNVLTLDQAVETAERNQPQLRAARAQTRAAEARAGEAFAPLLPQLVGTAAYERTTANSAPRPGLVPLGVTSASAALRGATFDTFNFWNFDLHLSQLVWDFQSVDRYRSVRETAEATEATERVTRQTVLLNVRTAYFTARAQKALVEVARETLANQDLHLGQVEGFVRVGTQPEIALATARTNRANAAFQLINAENNYDIARAQLNQAMGVEGATDYDVADEAIAPIPGEDASTDELVREAVEARPEIVSLEKQVRAAELTKRSVWGGYFPSLGVSMDLSDVGTDISSLVWNWNVTGTLTWNLFSGFQTRETVREAEANIEAARAQLDIEKQQVRLDVDKGRLAVRAAKAGIAAADEALANAREQLRLAEGRYQAGVGNIIELSDAQVALTNAGAQKVQADFNLATARAQLLTALGRR